jgi:hypothetical protein
MFGSITTSLIIKDLEGKLHQAKCDLEDYEDTNLQDFGRLLGIIEGLEAAITLAKLYEE